MENEHLRRNVEVEEVEEVQGRRKYPDYCRTLTFRDASGQVKELVLPKALDLDRPKRARTTFSPDQLYQLESEFCRNQYLVGRERSQLALKLGLSETQVKVWFQNRRTKYKRDKGRDDEVKPLSANSPSDAFTNSCNSLFKLPSLSPSLKPTSTASSASSLPMALPLPPSMNFSSAGSRFGSFSTASFHPPAPPPFPVLPMLSPMYPLSRHPIRPLPLSSGMQNSGTGTGVYGHATYSAF